MITEAQAGKMDNSEKRKILYFPAAVCSALAIFAVTLFAYADKARVHIPAGYLPGIVGLLVFATVMLWLTHLILPKQMNWRISVLFASVMAETAVFLYLLMFLLLNLYGS